MRQRSAGHPADVGERVSSPVEMDDELVSGVSFRSARVGLSFANVSFDRTFRQRPASATGTSAPALSSSAAMFGATR